MTIDAERDAPTPQTPLTAEQRAMVEANTALVPWFVNRWHSRASDEEKEEHVANGMLGLIRAVQLFDPTKGFKFSTYAHPWIRQAIQRGQAMGEGIGFRQTTNWNGSNGAAKTYDAWQRPDSLDRLVGEEDGRSTLGDLIACDADTEAEALASENTQRMVGALLKVCRDALDVDVLAAIVNGDQISEIAERHGVSSWAAVQRKNKLAARMRHPTGCTGVRRTNGDQP